MVTWMLITGEEVLESFGYHPLRIFEAALAIGWPRERPPAGIDLPLMTLGRYGNRVRLKPLPRPPLGSDPNTLRSCAIGWTANFLAITVDGQRLLLTDALLSLLPMSVCAKLSFTTSLACSPRRPFRLHFLSSHSDEARNFCRIFRGEVVDEKTSQVLSKPLSERSQRLGKLLEERRWCDVRRLVER